jgi:hypothetical protein
MGVVVKLAGMVSLDPLPGRLTGTFENNPQLPFEDLKLHFFGGERAPLATPDLCGIYTTNGMFVPWSGNSPVVASSSFQIIVGPNNGPCPPGGIPPFAPGFQGGTTSIQAGVFSPFVMTLFREDGEQGLGKVSVTTPPGLLGVLKNVEQCSEAQANTGRCSVASQIGHAIVGAGVGSDPLVIPQPGEPEIPIYLTGPYEGAPFGLSVVVPAIAGPFDLGTVVVRATISVNPYTAQVTVTTYPSGPYSIPQILDGVPIRLRTINVTIDRKEFVFNPTSCEPMSVTGTLASAEGASAAVSSPFQVTNCATLRFAPKFAVSTEGKASKRNGASLNVKLTFPHPGPQSSSQSGEANIARVHVQLPKSLPARLTTLQKACPDKVFEANPAGCPKESIVGQAIAHTPILNVPLQGPAFFVSHGGAKFPELILVLQGEGITIDLAGETDIKHGVTTSTFAHVPDAPVTSFELALPQGPFSALAANGNLCTQNLEMPTEFVAQNGATLSQNTHIEVEGCEFVVKVKSGKSHRGEPRRTGIKEVRDKAKRLGIHQVKDQDRLKSS